MGKDWHELTRQQRESSIVNPHAPTTYLYIEKLESLPDSDIVFVRKARTGEPPKRDRTCRGTIQALSRKSWLLMVERTLRCPHKFKRMVTITYAQELPETSSICKKQFRKFLTWLQKTSALKNYFWCLEFQERGAPHYHIWHDGKGIADCLIVSSWREITGDFAITECRDEKLRKSPAHYVAKEMTKRYQKEAPDGWPPGRFWGHSKFEPMPLETVIDARMPDATCPSILFSQWKNPRENVLDDGYIPY